MRIGLSAALEHSSPEEWAKHHSDCGCKSVNFPVNFTQGIDLALQYAQAARAYDMTIAEVGVWRNPISPDSEVRKAAFDFAVGQLAMADELGANCCVNVVGSCGERWDGAYKDNFTKETWNAVVKSIQAIIDAVNPKHTYYTIEPMPWMFPTGPDEYVRLIEDVARDCFAVHMDVFNWITTPQRYFSNEEFMAEAFEKLGKYVKSCHIKDVLLEQPFTIMFKEVACGGGAMNLEKYVSLAEAVNPDMPMIIEHLHSEAEYLDSIEYVKARLR